MHSSRNRISEILSAVDSLAGFALLRLKLAQLVFLGATLWLITEAAIGQPNLALAKRYHAGLDIQAYYVSEKLDGVRAYWDGKVLRSRQGHPFAAPEWFVQGFPAQPLDGELWIKRNAFAETSGIVRRASPHKDWHQIKFMLFDMPTVAGSFIVRLHKMQSIVAAAKLPQLQLVEQHALADEAALQKMFRNIVQAGGEGVMLRRKIAPYRGGRTDDLLKLKPFMDAEAVVVNHHAGKGKYQQVLGALEVKMANGRRFRIGSGLSDAERKAPPPIGSVITYRYSGFTRSGLPRFPVFLRMNDSDLLRH